MIFYNKNLKFIKNKDNVYMFKNKCQIVSFWFNIQYTTVVIHVWRI